MSERALLDLVDRPTMPKLKARPSRAIDSPLTSVSESSRVITFVTPSELDLESVEEGLTGLQRQHLKLREEVLMQSGSLKRVEDGLQTVRETADRNAQEQQQLLEPIEEGLAGLQRQHLKLREDMLMQSGSLKLVEDGLQTVREATDRSREAIDRNVQEQQKFLDDLKAFGSKMKAVAMVGISLLVVGLVLESAMYVHLKSMLP